MHAGFNEITLAVGHLAELIAAYFGDGSRLGVQLAYSREETPLGTAGPIALVPNINDSFLVMNGDVLTDLDFKIFYDYHSKEKNLFTISTCKREVCSEFGVTIKAILLGKSACRAFGRFYAGHQRGKRHQPNRDTGDKKLTDTKRWNSCFHQAI